MRPKQPPRKNERTLQALLNRGVEYVELRSNDVGIFDPLSIDETQLRFLEAFLIFCLLYESPPISSVEQVDIELNQIEVARNGRHPQLQLYGSKGKKAFKAWAGEICEMMQGICELLDQGQPEQLYQRCLEQQRAAIEDPDRTPSAHVLAAMKESGMGFFHFVKTLSKQHQEYFLSLPFSRELQGYFEDLAQQSHQQQAAMEAADSLSFDEYLVRYSAQ
jgi:glutamate--cysteine ligase